jgi:hypothetical protein
MPLLRRLTRRQVCTLLTDLDEALMLDLDNAELHIKVFMSELHRGWWSWRQVKRGLIRANQIH